MISNCCRIDQVYLKVRESITCMIMDRNIHHGTHSYLYDHGQRTDNVDFVLVPTPDTAPIHDCHTADRLLGVPQHNQVVVDQVPLTI